MEQWHGYMDVIVTGKTMPTREKSPSHLSVMLEVLLQDFLHSL